MKADLKELGTAIADKAKGAPKLTGEIAEKTRDGINAIAGKAIDKVRRPEDVRHHRIRNAAIAIIGPAATVGAAFGIHRKYPDLSLRSIRDWGQTRWEQLRSDRPLVDSGNYGQGEAAREPYMGDTSGDNSAAQGEADKGQTHLKGLTEELQATHGGGGETPPTIA